MANYRFQHNATLCFSVKADTEEEARDKALATLQHLPDGADWPNDDDALAAAGSPVDGLEARAYIDNDDDNLELIDWKDE